LARYLTQGPSYRIPPRMQSKFVRPKAERMGTPATASINRRPEEDEIVVKLCLPSARPFCYAAASTQEWAGRCDAPPELIPGH
jgi:hypothetical protein